MTIFVLLLSAFLYLDNKTYYYGFGKGLISYKLPNYLKPYYSGSDLGNTGFALTENDETAIDVLNNIFPIYLENNKKIKIKKFLGYGFSEDVIVVKIVDSTNKEIYIRILNNNKSDYIFDELKSIPKNLRYINLDKDLNYFKKIKLIKNFVLISLILSFIFLLKEILYKKE